MTPRHKTFLQSLGIRIPIVQAPMAGADSPDLAIAVSDAGGLGSLACALLSPDEVREGWTKIRLHTSAPINLNFFCHKQQPDTREQQDRWEKRLLPYYKEMGLDIRNVQPTASRTPFDENFCTIVEEIKPPVVSFHFGLPAPDLIDRVKKTGATIFSSATTLQEAVWLQEHGCDVIIAQGAEAGGHRAMFLKDDIEDQPDMDVLVSSITGKMDIPVIAAGGIADAEKIRRVLSLGAIAVQVGTAYLFCKEARVSPVHLRGLNSKGTTALTNVYTGRPARGIINRFIREAGPISSDAPDFPYASTLVNPLRKASESASSFDFVQMWSGKNRVPHNMDAKSLTISLYEQAYSING